jgi:hypothetical protein
MNTRTTVSKRTLLVDFELYADNDPEFKQELIALMIDNLTELHSAFKDSVKQNDPDIFRKSCHKMKTTLVMLEDPELDAIVIDLKQPDVEPGSISRFGNVIAELIESLSEVK